MTNIIIVSRSLIPSVLLCGHSQLEYISKEKDIDYRFVASHMLTTEVLSWSDIIIFLRSESELEAYASDLCKKAHKHMIYVLDDDLLNAPDYLSSSSYYNRPDIKENMKKIMGNCDTFLTSSPVMLKKYGNMFNRAYQIHEPSLNVIRTRKKNRKIRIGFAGSIDRAQDINLIISDALRKVVKKYKNEIEIEFMGAKPDIVDELGLTYVPYTASYEEYTDVIKERNWDIGLAPMPDSEFHRCKYFNKYVEYASFGIAGIYSDVEPYVFGIRDKENGLLVKNETDRWYKALVKLIDDDELRTVISRNCLKEAKSIYSLKTLAADYYEKVMSGYTERERLPVKGLWKYRVKTIYNRLKYKVKEQGINFPVWAINKIYKVITKKDN